MDAHDAVLRACYARGMEQDRLSSARGQLEFARPCEIVLRALRESARILKPGGVLFAAAIRRA